jgi:hypothetical protein
VGKIVAARARRAHNFAHMDKPRDARLCPPYRRFFFKWKKWL